jgi:hypothetical protein
MSKVLEKTLAVTEKSTALAKVSQAGLVAKESFTRTLASKSTWLWAAAAFGV